MTVYHLPTNRGGSKSGVFNGTVIAVPNISVKNLELIGSCLKLKGGGNNIV